LSLDERCDQWASDLAEIEWVSLPEDVRERTLIAVFDALGVAAGGRVAPGVEGILNGIEQSSGSGEVPVPWTDLRIGPSGAAAALSTLIHAWDFDDTHDEATVHTCCVAIPAAIAAAFAVGSDGADVLAGIVVGIQTLVRTSLAVGPQRGMVRTAGLGPLAAAAAAARAMRLDPPQFLAALQLAIASAGAPTTRQVVEDGTVNKRFQPAQSVQAGVNAAFLAANGTEGPTGWMTGTFGVLSWATDPEQAVSRLEQPGWAAEEISLKPYPCCRYTHSSIKATLDAGCDGATVALVHVPVGTAYEFVARPFARRGLPIIDAQFSIPWLVAAALLDGRVDLETMAGERLTDPDVDSAAANVVVLQDLQPTKDNMAPAHVELNADGVVHSSRILQAPGSPDSLLGWDDVAAKAAPCVAVGGFSKEIVGSLEKAVRELETIGSKDLGAFLSNIGRFSP
jgi:2-methylcitrate dehydratase PrpD